MAPRVVHSTVTGATADPTALVDGPAWDADHVISGLDIGSDVQAHDDDLDAIAALTPSDDDIIQRKGGTWTNRSPAQYIADLGALGTTFQPLDSDLTALASNSTNGLWARTGAGTGAARTITGTANAISVTNGDGVSGNPTLAISSDAALPGNPTTTTQAVDNNTTRVATTAYVVSQAAAAAPLGNAPSAVVGTSTRFARADHVHPGREVLTANRTYYVRSDGSNSNNGLANTSGGAFLTIQKAIDVAAALDISIYTVTIQIGNTATFSGTVTVNSPWVGSGDVVLQGDGTTPSNTLLTSTSNTGTIVVRNGGRLHVRNFKVTNTGGGSNFFISNGSLKHLGGIDHGAASFAHWYTDSNGVIYADYGTAVYTISGGALVHFFASLGGTFYIRATTITLTGTPAFGSAFVNFNTAGKGYLDSLTFSGAAAAGQRSLISENSVVNTGGAGTSYFPGNAYTAPTTGGQYV